MRRARMRRVPAVAMTIGAVLAVAAAAPAAARTEEASLGAVKATASYDSPAEGQFTNLKLTVVRQGATLFDGAPAIKGCQAPYCVPAGAYSDGGGTLQVADLDGDGEPEVLVDVFSGGAHCCSLLKLLRFDGTRYTAIDHDFLDPGYELEDLDGDGTPELSSADGRFGYAFTAYAYSSMPIQIWRLAGRRLADVTGEYKPRLRKDANVMWKRYRRRRTRTDGIQRGAIAAWAADEYRLGRKAQAVRVLRREVRAGRLRGDAGSPAAFVRSLQRFLRKAGYEG